MDTVPDLFTWHSICQVFKNYFGERNESFLVLIKWEYPIMLSNILEQLIPKCDNEHRKSNTINTCKRKSETKLSYIMVYIYISLGSHI